MGLLSYLKKRFPKSAEEIASHTKKQRPQATSYGTWIGGNLTGGEKWQGGISQNGGVTVIDTAKTLQNARSASHQSPQARVMIERPATLAVDTGLKLEPTPAWKTLGITDDSFKEQWTSEHEERFDLYMSSKQCHRSGINTGYQLQQLWAWCDGRDNDQFGRLFYSKDRNLVSPVQLEFVDPTIVNRSGFTGAGIYTQSSAGYWTDTVGNQYSLKDGILRNSKNQEVGFTVRVPKKTGSGFETVIIPAIGSRSKRVHMFHGYKQEYPGQGRGFSKLHFALQDFQSIVDYVSSIVKKAINQGGITGYVKPGENAPSSNPMEDQQGGPIVDDSLEEDEIITAADYCFERTEYKSRVPGSDFYANLMPGETIEFPKDTAPGPEFDKFITSIFKYVSAARGYPIEVILMAFNSNYSASRAALLEAWRTGRISQQDIKADLMDIWWEMWLSEEIAAGRSHAPGWNDPRLRQAWMRYILQGPPLPSIDPGKDIAASEKKIKYQISTQKREAREMNGSDVNQNIIVNKKLFAETPTVPWEDEPEPAGTPEPEEPNSNSD